MEGSAIMKDNKISRTQLMVLLWAGVMAPAAELLPGLLLPGVGRGAWLAVLLAAPLVRLLPVPFLTRIVWGMGRFKVTLP